MKRKRLFSLLLVLALLLGLLPSALAAVGTGWNDECRVNPVGDGYGKHNWVKQSEKPGKSCTSKGTATYSCSYCGATATRETKAPGHKWGNWKTTKEATCTSQGEETRKCSVCGQTETRKTDKLAHTWGEWTVVAEPTDHSAGTRTRACQVCGTESTQEFDPEGTLRRGDSGEAVKKLQEGLICYGVLNGTADGSFGPGTEKAVMAAQAAEGLTADGVAWPQTQARLGHQFGDWETTQEMTDFTIGIKQRVCARCGYTETEETWPEPTYRRGDKGDGVKELQEKLNAAGYDCGTADGDFGGKTESAVKAIETAHGIEADGIAWPGVQKWLAGPVEAIPNYDNGDSANDFLNRFRLIGVGLRNNEEPLAIVTQPVAGRLSADGGDSVLLTVEAVGGTPPYSYQWRRRFFGLDIPIEGATGQSYPADKVGAYSCRVTDDAMQFVDSDRVEVDFELHIDEQPVNTNLHGQGSVKLWCIAAGGAPFTGSFGAGTYNYAWYDTEGTEISASQEPTVDIDTVGEYYCVVEDAEGTQRTSLPALVYDAEPLTIEEVPKSVYLRKGDAFILSGRVVGGIEPYSVAWRRGEEELPTTLAKDGSYTTPIVCDGSEAVEYTLHVSDVLLNEAEAAETVYYKQLAIAKQPQGGMLPQEGALTLELEMAEGEAPFTYTLYLDDAPKAEWQSDALVQTWVATQPGDYRFHIVDTAGDWADSAQAVVKEFSFHIDHIDVEGEIGQAGDTATLTAVVEGGEAPIQYIWWLRTEDAEGNIVGDKPIQEGEDPVLDTSRPGLYRCYAKDADGRVDVMTARVPFAGSGPIIVRQPESVSLNFDKDELYSATLTCEAFADGAHELKYEWEKKGTNGWKLFYIGDTMKYSENTTDTHYYYIKGGVFRCKVTDAVTGQTAYSDEATITMPKLTVTGEQVGHGTSIALHIEGGNGPYTITCKRWRHAFDSYFNFVIESYDLTDHLNMYVMPHWADGTVDGLSKHARKYGVLEAEYIYRHWTYVFTVTDAEGNQAKLSVIMWRENGFGDNYMTLDETFLAPDAPPGFDIPYGIAP